MGLKRAGLRATKVTTGLTDHFCSMPMEEVSDIDVNALTSNIRQFLSQKQRNFLTRGSVLSAIKGA